MAAAAHRKGVGLVKVNPPVGVGEDATPRLAADLHSLPTRPFRAITITSAGIDEVIKSCAVANYDPLSPGPSPLGSPGNSSPTLTSTTRTYFLPVARPTRLHQEGPQSNSQ